MHKVEWEPGLRDFLPDFSSLDALRLDQQVSFHYTPMISILSIGWLDLLTSL